MSVSGRASSDIEYRAQKIRAFATAMIGRLIVADQKIIFLKPLLHDQELIKKWDSRYGAYGLNLLRMTLYLDLIREMAAISFDRYPKSPSIKNVLQLLESPDLLNHLKNEYCEPLPINWIHGFDENFTKYYEEKNRQRKLIENEQKFNDIYQRVNDDFKSLKDTELYKRIQKTRDKRIAHYEMYGDGEELRMHDPTDFGLKWRDGEDYFNLIKPIITNLVLIISNERHAVLEYWSPNEKIANDFWYK